jgi:PAS domain S-box-containing protein
MQDVVFTLSMTGTLTSLNAAFERITGWSWSEWVGRPFADLVHPDDLNRALDNFARVLDQRSPGLFELRIKARDGSWLDGEFSGVQLLENGGVVGALGTVRDVTQRRRETEERKRLAAAVEQAAEAIMVTDVEGTIEYVNPAFERISGYAAGEVLGANPRILKSGKHDEGFYRKMWETLWRGEVWSGRFVNRCKDGSLIEEDATISPVRDPSGRVAHFVAVKRDVTQEALLEQQLRQVQRLEAIGRLAGGVAHDFNNLLQAMLSQTQIIHNNPDDARRVADTVDELEQQIRRGAALSRQLLLFSRRETAKPERLDLSEVVGGATQLLRRLVRENIAFAVELADEPLPVIADRGQIDQVLMNLVVNASDAMPEGGRLVVGTGVGEGGTAWLSVEDTGQGVPEGIRDRIFEPFFTTKGADKGSGLGLAVVHGIVAQHDGTIRVSDREGGGTVFRIELPKASTGEALVQAASRVEADDLPRGRGERVLVVEDETGAREGLVDLLTMLGYEVAAVGSAEEARRLPQESAFDVLLSDLLLPDVSGAELARGLLECWPRLKVILMSGYTEDEAVRRGVGAGTLRFLQKPFDMRTLAREIRTAIAEGTSAE